MKEKSSGNYSVNEIYRYWRVRTFYSICLGYVCFVLTYKNFTFIVPQIIQNFHLQTYQLGVVSGIACFVSYFVSGMLSDRYNPGRCVALSLIIVGIANIFFGVSTSLFWWLSFFAINIFFHILGWVSCIRLLMYWYSKSERGTLWGVWNTFSAVGGVIVLTTIPRIVTTFANWQAALFIPGTIAIVAGIFALNRLKGIPEYLGLPSIEIHNNDDLSVLEMDDEGRTIIGTFFYNIFKNHRIWLLAFLCILIATIRTIIIDWGRLYLEDTGQTWQAPLAPNNHQLFLQIAGVIGGLIAGWCSDKIFQGMRLQTNIIFVLGSIFSFLLFWLTPATITAIYYPHLILAITFFAFGATMMILLTAVELSPKKTIGTTAGFIMLFIYSGSILSNLLIGIVTQNFGWNYLFAALSGCSILSVLLLWRSIKPRAAIS